MQEFISWLLLASLTSTSAESQGVYISQAWSGGFHGHVTLSPSQDLHGWEVHVKFSKPIDSLEVWTAKVSAVSSDKTEYTLTNKDYDRDIHGGSELQIDFNGHMSGDTAPTATLSSGGGSSQTSAPSGGGGSATKAPATQAPATSAPQTGGSSNLNSHPSTKFDYAKALKLSILFFDAQRSGRLPSNNPIPWRSDSAVNDNGDGHDLSGGWYDAGDHVKFNLPQATATHVLAWGLEKFKDAYQASGQLDMMYDMLRTPLDYFLKCWQPDRQVYWVQVGNGEIDHGYWGRPEDMHMSRPAYKVTAGSPGSDVAGNTAAALAVGSLVYKDKDASYSAKLLAAAKSLYAFAKAHPGIYSNSVPEAKNFYGSSGWEDEMCEAAGAMYKVTKDQQYLNDAKGYDKGSAGWAYSWDAKNAGCQLLLWEATHEGKYKGKVEEFVNSYDYGGSVPITPCGLSWRDKWGSNGYAAGASTIAVLAAADGIGGDKFKKLALRNIDYMLGENRQHFSYVIGFGSNFPKKPHHRAASCAPGYCANAGQDSPNQINGALVGGPGRNDDYEDKRDDYIKNEVSVISNGVFQTAVAGLYHFAINNQLPPPPAPKC
ncbi:uncharacterized protein [Mytilus edulis]|uniref:uncharacterized protein n=1 Tax=Mytilus edulis TaxID=6550 RepID=UPI0039EF8ABD